MEKEKMSRSVKIKLLMSILVLVLVGAGATFAFMFRKSDVISNKFTSSKSSCVINTEYDKTSGTLSSVTVKNNGDVDSYIRVKMVSAWINDKNQFTGKESENITFTPAAGWVYTGDNIYTYTEAVKPGMSTGELLGSEVVLKKEDKYKQTLDILSESIQSDPGTAVSEAWNISFDESVAYAASLRLEEESTVKSDFAYITVNFLDEKGSKLSNPNISEIKKNSAYDLKITVPVILGYGAFYNPDNLAETNPDNALTYIPSELTQKFNSVKNDETINVFYKPADVPYAVRYYFQNVNDDLYTERTDLYTESVAKTGTLISDEDLKAPESQTKGFRVLYHYPEKIAADGSTVFEMYYDREFYKIDLDLNGGYGADDYYLRYGSTYSVNTPKQAGYTFAGWDKLTEDKNGDGIPDTGDGVSDTYDLSGIVPDYNQYYRALWTPGETNVTYVVWKQNADPNADGTYDYSYWNSISKNVTPGTTVSGYDAVATEKSINWGSDSKYFYLADVDKDVKVKGDDSTVVNIYYDRKDYTLNFYYAREKYTKTVTDVYERYLEGISWSDKVYIETIEDISKTEYEIPGKINKFSESKKSLSEALKLKNGDGNDWVKVKELPVLTRTDYNNINLDDSETSRSEEKGYINWPSVYEYKDITTTTYYKYYGIQLTGKYGSTLVSNWPGMCFEPVHDTGSGSYEFGAWGPENSTYYIQHTNEFGNNPTVKGMFLTLDYRLLYDSKKGDSDTINFLSYWANVNHNTQYPLCEWRYNVYTEPYSGQDIQGLPQKILGGKLYVSNGSIPSFDSNGKVDAQTPPILRGFEIKTKRGGNGIYSEDGRGSFDKKYPEGIDGFYVNYYYNRNNYSLSFKNHGESLDSMTKTVGYHEPMAKYEPTDIPPYPANLEPGAFEFEGWYTSPTGAEGTKYDFANEKMPDSNVVLYAKYVPIKHTVNFFSSYEDYKKYEEDKDAAVTPYQTEQVDYGNVAGQITPPVHRDESGEYKFAGWFYMKNGKKTAFDPVDTPIKKDINVFADWGTKTAQPYVIHYVLESDPSVKVAEDTFGYGYQGTTRTFIPKGGGEKNELFEEYSVGYYPTVQSHSVTINYEPNKENPTVNEYTFKYAHAEKVDYKIEFKDRKTNEDLLPPVTKKTDLSVVTEKFKFVQDYVPDAFYKTKVLAVVKDQNGNWVSSPDNVITFNYTKSSKTMYAVHYMLQKPGTEKGTFDDANYVEQKTLTEGFLERDNTAITPNEVTGHMMLKKAVQKKNDGTKVDINVNDDNKTFNAQFDENGVELYVYYDCIQYEYSVKFVDMNNRNELGEMKEIVQPWISPVKADYGQKITINLEETPNSSNPHVVPSEYKPDKLKYTPVRKSESVIIRDTENVITFLYVPVQYTVQYDVYEDGTGIPGGKVSKPSETVQGKESFSGSVPVPDEDYKFDGWYKDKECTQKVDAKSGTVDPLTNKFTPDVRYLKASPEENHFYAKFIPKYGMIEITSSGRMSKAPIVYNIKKTGTTGNGIDIVISGGSKVIYNLPAGEYTITEKNSTWSWRYGQDALKKVVVKENETTQVKFNTEKTNKKWLNGYDRISLRR